MSKVFSFYVVMLSSCLPFLASAQSPFFHYFQDSLKPGYRISGNLDSTDRSISGYQSTLPDTWLTNNQLFTPQVLLGHDLSEFSRRYSSIAHVGLFYSMGSAANQPAGISYTQQVNNQLSAQFDYRRNFSGELMRNTGFESNYVQGSLRFIRPRIGSSIDVNFQSRQQSYSDGLFGDTLSLPEDELIFQSVTRSAASQRTKRVRIVWRNYYSFLKDSLRKTGLYIKPELRIDNRRFQDDQISSLYTTYNYDSLATNDYSELRTFQLSVGYFYHSQNIQAEIGGDRTYWDFDNLTLHRDTTEWGINGRLLLQLTPKLQFSNSIHYTLVGALGELNYKGHVSWNSKRAKANAFFGFDRQYPQQFQRHYIGNHIAYDWKMKQLQTVVFTGLSADLTLGKIPLSALVKWTNLQNHAWYLDSAWRQDTLTNVAVLQASLRGDLSFKNLIFQPSFHVALSEQSFLPRYQTYLRFGFRGALFKAKKLQTAIGIDAGYIGSYGLMDFDPMFHVYTFTSSGKSFAAMPKLHAFANFDLGFFRWFFRFENIEQTFTKSNQQLLGYPVVPLQLRFGFSWDLFN
jgi:hypothetical protein